METATETSQPRGKQARPSTPRTQQLRQIYMEQKPSLCAERSMLVTESYKETEALPPVIRQAMAFDKVLSEIPAWIIDGELIVSNIASRQKGVFLFPEYDDTWLEEEMDTVSTREGDWWLLNEEDKPRIRECIAYWKGKNLAAIIDATTPDEVKEAERNSFINIDMGKQAGIGHVSPDTEGVIRYGLNALIRQAEEHLESLDLANPDDYDKMHFLKALIIADKAVIKWAGRFADLAREKAAVESDPDRKAELEEIADICRRVPAEPARNFREALQTTAFVMASMQIETNGVSAGPGRLDQYLFPFYESDIGEGRITKERAVELLECLFMKLAESNRAAAKTYTMAHYGYPFWVQVPVGGQTPDGYDATNELSYLMLEVSTNLQLHEPTVSARIHNRTPEKFLLKCCEAIKRHGGGNPALFNDEVIIPSQLANVPGITKEDAYNYTIVGCSEVVFAGKGTEGIPYHALSFARVLELMMEDRHPVTGQKMGSPHGDMLQWQSFDDVMAAFKEKAGILIRVMFMQVLPLVEAHTRYRPCPYLSSLTQDCITRGRSYYDGGAIYGNGVVNVCYVGIATVANSLAAIRKLVFDDKVITAEQLKHALETNFEDGSTTPTGEEVLQLCLKAPKYGNDEPYVDNIAKDYLNIAVKEMARYHTRQGGGYEVTIAPVATHIVYGMLCGATPDGRKKGEPLSDSVSPAQGTDVNGPTAAIKSVANLEHINFAQGTIFNMKMHPGPLESKAGMLKWADLIRTYFDLGGWEIQFNVVDAETLRDAQVHPENYQDLVVRVVGYSAFFVELEKSVQDDIISRTEHAM
ncbi:MAG: formate C-acetyltransferase/glycerol dehydratase family glycyl radical enzyme [Dehalococcoidia bacterium]